MPKNDFEIVDEVKQAREWKRLQIIIIASLGVVSTGTIALVLFNLEMDFRQRLNGLAAVGVMLLLAGLGQLSHGFFPAILNQRVRNAVGISACAMIVLGLSILAYVVLPRVDFTVGQFVMAVVWALALVTGGLWGFIGGLEKAAWEKTAMPER